MKQSTKDRILSETPDEVKQKVRDRADLLVNKQETLEEVSERYANMQEDVSENIGKYLVKAVFKDGAYWNQERSYSEEEVVNILMKVYEDIGKRKIPNPVVLAEWYEHYKK